ncbi:alpha-amylase family glycosyl hydrolase [Mangrovibacterium diazotrophicum]|uniref:Putative secreted protein (Por secretion system target) n=1 Tax=Mangrovibacterium diazotrophicum TaxID=1261403 RepID=A0A419VUW8_9BACT|nr:alpha-amylase family glycosyl hydrolase [Mangrovibacterium diazotrophicum]RKD85143.1 putative secreted protein (Por secretion system target) [Mangrovibacterium diazotrophicum]
MKYFLPLIFLFVSFLGKAQITSSPAFPTASVAVTITFDSSMESRLGYFTGDLYAHTGVKIEGSDSWQHVIGSWANNTTQPKLTYLGSGRYELVITPDINTYYSVPATETVTQLMFVFRSADGTKQTNDLPVTVYQSSLAITISSPEGQTLFQQNSSLSISALSSADADLSLKMDETLLASQTGSSISTTTTLTDTGWKWLIASASLNGSTTYDSLHIFVSPAPGTQAKPSSYKQGINYISETEVGLVLLAPNKTDIYVLGDFNDWTPSTDYQMKKDGEYFWITLSNLTPQQEYIYQYWIDGDVRVGDPLCDKISDPYDDSYITDAVYPDLIVYPSDKTSGRASVLQTGQTAYEWKTSSWTLPSKENLLIYELLIRDFTEDGTYQAVIDKLGYLERLGVNAIELMPFSEFEGNSSWGYNPNYYFAPDKAYGTKDDLKELIDSIHNRGMIVIQDMVLNHAYNSCPMAKMYWDDTNSRPSADNPWFNVTSPNTAYSWGSDFNHESTYTQAFVDTVTSYWMNEYKVDGFRFDFTKGFTNTAGDGSAYDASRIAILERMANHIWSVKSDAYVILEHFAANAEEQVLTSYSNGMMVWGNGNYNFNEATMGWNDNSDFSWSSYQARGFAQPGLVAYMESHDEERLMYKNLQYGNSSGDYDITQLATALERNAMAAAFFFSLAGPKMIWQFGELGYDYSIDYNERVGEKPVKWDYLDDTNRQKLFDVYSAMLRLRKQYPVFTSGTETRSLSGATKSLQLSKDGHHITLIGNFGVASASISAPFSQTGTWYEFFTGETYAVSSTSQTITLAAGEYRLYSDQQLPAFKDLATDVEDQQIAASSVSVFPNPASTQLWVQADEKITELRIFTMDGKLIREVSPEQSTVDLNIANLQNGVYFLQINSGSKTTNSKFIKSN